MSYHDNSRIIHPPMKQELNPKNVIRCVCYFSIYDRGSQVRNITLNPKTELQKLGLEKEISLN